MSSYIESSKDGYRYAPLYGDRPIRLLFLYPGDEAAPLVCKMKAFSLNEKPGYKALSYVWGADALTEILQIQEKRRQYSMKIKPSLAGALRRLRHGNEDRVLWADAICIDQYNSEEKSLQVNIRDQIYYNASSVQVWLGEAADDSDEAVDFIDSVTDLSCLDRLVKDLSATRRWFALSRLMQRPWFTCKWIIQELALAKKATLHCGSRSVDWPQFADAVSLFAKRHLEIARLFRQSSEFDNDAHTLGEIQQIGALSLIKVCNRLFRKSEDGRILFGLLSLETLVEDLGSFQSTIPHDTIYSLLNLAGDVQPESSFPIDYSQRFNELAKTFIEFAIMSSKSLDVLCRPWAPESTTWRLKSGSSGEDQVVKEPSWICPLSNAAFDNQLNKRYARKNADSLLGSPGHPYYNASSGFPISKISFERDNPDGPFQSIFIKGIICGTIATIGDPARSGVIPSHWFDIGNWSSRQRPVPDAFWRTLVADRCPDGVNPAPWYSRACEYAFGAGGYVDDVDTKQPIENGRSLTAAEFLQRVQAVTWKRRIVLTNDGSLGLVPEGAKEGDLIVVLFGCSVPVVLRPEENYYIMIGQSYIHGLMDGKNLPRWQKSGRVSSDDTRCNTKIPANWTSDLAVGQTEEPQSDLFHKSPELNTEIATSCIPTVFELR